MKSYLDCYPCFLKQAIQAGELATDDVAIRWAILQKVTEAASAFKREDTPAIMGREIHRIVRELSNNPDPYKDVKRKYNKKAMELIPFIEKEISQSENKLATAIKMTAIANIIDFGPFGIHQVNFQQFIDDKLTCDLKGDISVEQFSKPLKEAESILYVADNCGEIIIDAYFINNFLSDKTVYLSLRGSVVLNDATIDDVANLSFGENVEIIDNGDDAPGVILEYSKSEFLEIYNKVDLVVLKGQGNYEGIGVPDRRNVYSVLTAKCPVIATNIGCNVNDLVLTIPG